MTFTIDLGGGSGSGPGSKLRIRVGRMGPFVTVALHEGGDRVHFMLPEEDARRLLAHLREVLEDGRAASESRGR